MKKSTALVTAALFLMPFYAARAEQAVDFANCAGLRDKDAYGSKFDSLMFLVPGKDEWFFRTKQDLRQDFPLTEQGTKIFSQFSAALKQRGTELIIAYIPTRGMGAAEFMPHDHPLTTEYDPDKAAQNYADFIAGMNEKGVTMVGLPHPSTKEPFFYKADQHWTTFGASEMARALAAKIKTRPGYAEIEKKQFKTDAKESVSFKGKFNLGLKGICGIETVKERDTLTVTAESGEGLGNEKALFSEAAAPQIVLVGTSNSKKKDNNLNFDGLLQQELSAEVLNVAISGGALSDSMLAYLVSDDFHKSPPKFLVWEIPGYYDLMGEETRNLLRQFVPAIYGDCGDKNLVSSSSAPLQSGQNVEIFQRLKIKRIAAKESYLSLRFNQKVHQDFSITIEFKDAPKEKVKFKRSKNFPFDGVYFYMPQSEGTISSLTLAVPKQAEGWAVDAKLCSMPGVARAIVPDEAPDEKEEPTDESWFDRLLKRFGG